MKTFKDLTFGQHINPNITDIIQARMEFSNGYGISVLLGGYGIHSNGIDTYEVAILYNDKLCYDTGLCDDVLGHQTESEITELMEKIQQLPSKSAERVVNLTNEEIVLLHKSVSDKLDVLNPELEKLMREFGLNRDSIFFKEITKEIDKYTKLLEKLK